MKYSATPPESGLGRLRALLGKAGREVLEKALCLHFAALRPETPRWARLTAWSALAYLVMPLDAIPDWIPGTGYSDDLLTLVYAVVTIARFVDDDVRLQAQRTLQNWFAPAAPR